MTSVKEVNIRTISRFSSPSNSLIRLLASTTTSGSIKTVLPVADSSCTIPLIFRLNAGATGIINLPSRIVGETSLSTTPSLCAARKIDCKLREILLIVIVISRLMDCNSEEAESFTFPNLSIMESIFPINCGKGRMSPANSVNFGYLISPSSSGRKKRRISNIVCNERFKSNSSFSSNHVPSGRIRFSE